MKLKNHCFSIGFYSIFVMSAFMQKWWASCTHLGSSTPHLEPK